MEFKDVQYDEDDEHEKRGILSVYDGWFSKINSGNVNAKQMYTEQGYPGRIFEYGGNDGRLCKYPGKEDGTPNKLGGSWESFGFFVSWKCSNVYLKQILNDTILRSIYNA